jgi:2-isopropylmalate synthase
VSDRFITLFDTTLRDGTQGEGISLSVADKLRIAHKLDALGVHYIEGGWPGSNAKDIEFFTAARAHTWQHARITAFGSTCRKGQRAHDDHNLRSLVSCGAQVATIFGKSWDFHVHTALQTTNEENIRMIFDSIAYLKSQGLEVIYDAEHFFDGYMHNAAYAKATIDAAMRAGAQWIVLCDTNGGTLPHDVADIVRSVHATTPLLGIHAHNDCECGVANSLAAVQAGARHVQGTFNGVGERCGNANLVSLIPNLQLKLGYTCISSEQLASLTSTARAIGEIANMTLPINQPYVGNAAFAHKGGIHVSAVLRHPKTYEHIDPRLVGNEQRVLVSELAGMSNLVFKAQQMGLPFDFSNEKSKQLIQSIKDLEHKGYQFEGADASLELLIRETFGLPTPVFDIDRFKLILDKSGTNTVLSEAILHITVNGEARYTVAEGNGPINALDHALRKALLPIYPHISDIHLIDYKVRVISEQEATASKVRVLITSSNWTDTWSTVGVSTNVIEASWQAIVDSIRYALIDQTPIVHTPSAHIPRGLSHH